MCGGEKGEVGAQAKTAVTGGRSSSRLGVQDGCWPLGQRCDRPFLLPRPLKADDPTLTAPLIFEDFVLIYTPRKMPVM
jgi:hypothetical protein